MSSNLIRLLVEVNIKMHYNKKNKNKWKNWKRKKYYNNNYKINKKLGMNKNQIRKQNNAMNLKWIIEITLEIKLNKKILEQII